MKDSRFHQLLRNYSLSRAKDCEPGSAARRRWLADARRENFRVDRAREHEKAVRT